MNDSYWKNKEELVWSLNSIFHAWIFQSKQSPANEQKQSQEYIIDDELLSIFV